MPGDYSRPVRSRGKGYASVLAQQGRVGLDSDWNALAEVVDTRLRLLALDCLGRFHISRQTPDAFQITAWPADLAIGIGRAYVDGLLVENLGSGPRVQDQASDRLVGPMRATYATQPFLPDPAPLPTEGRCLLYLDVWQREVTSVEDPELRNVATGGPDTSVRVQTPWQVRSMPIGERVTRETEWSKLDPWLELTEPSGSRLTTRGSYAGFENHLYRVEIHDDGSKGRPASFKWSRNNGSIALRIIGPIRSEGLDTAVPVRAPASHTVFAKPGDWVELLDDASEMAGKAGTMAPVAADNSAVSGLVVLEGQVDAPVDPSRNARIQRWDHASDVTSEGVVAFNPGQWIALEEGIELKFDVERGRYHVGDYWSFAARTRDGSVEELDSEPPDGPEHHYAPLAVVEFPDKVEDCRPTDACGRGA